MKVFAISILLSVVVVVVGAGARVEAGKERAAVTSLTMGELGVRVERGSDGRDEVRVFREAKRLDASPLPRESAGPKVNGLKVIDARERVFLVDYYKGSAGTKVIRGCDEAFLFALDKLGKLTALGSKEYRCEVIGGGPEAEEEAFSEDFEVVKVDGKYTLR